MRIRIGWSRAAFNPGAVDWKYQSSPDCQFGFWRSPKGIVFVKRFVHPPTGWGLLNQCVRKPVPNTPSVLAVDTDGQFLYLFTRKLEGDTFLRILQKGEIGKYFPADSLSDEDRLQIFMNVYAAIRHINARGYWYPDLDFKNLFIAAGCEIFLIDMDSCAELQNPLSPDHVSQLYWEGLVSTYHRAGKQFINRDDPARPVLAAHGGCINQSMIILFAYSIQRLGFVPAEMPLFKPLIDPRNPHSRWVLRTHESLARGVDCWREIDEFLPEFFKVSASRFNALFRRCSRGKGGWFAALADKIIDTQGQLPRPG